MGDLRFTFRQCVTARRGFSPSRLSDASSTRLFGRGAAKIAASFPSGDRGMRKKDNIERHSAAELTAMRKQGRSQTDWVKAEAMTQAQLEKSIAADPDEAGMTVDWANASLEVPAPKVVLNMRVDRDVLDFFRKTGRGYQTRINAVLRAFVTAQEHRSR
jgi:uncharacterized protein (DUF4415 family)